MTIVDDFARARSRGERIAIVTAYDAWSARLIAASPVDAILVGDSAAMVMHGASSTLPATVELMAMHTRAVAAGSGDTFVIGDLPFLSYRKGLAPAMDAVGALVTAGAHAVKLEGVAGHEDVIRHIVESGVPVMGHLGLTPQSVHGLGGYHVQGRDRDAAERLIDDARRLEELGCFSLVLECVPSSVAERITSTLTIPTIGIGAGPGTNGQVLVLHDLLGLGGGRVPKFVRQYLDGAALISSALSAYVDDVRGARFPSDAESYK